MSTNFDSSNNMFIHSENLEKCHNSQIFKYIVPKKIILLFFIEIKKLNNKNNENIIINKVIFKKLKFHNIISQFYSIIEKFYHKKKIFYIERKKTYKNFLTIIRQLCRLHNITYNNKLKYLKSTYEIYYIINTHLK